MSERHPATPEERIDVDARLGTALPDDLPPDVARRLERRIDAELARRRLPRPSLLDLLERLVAAPVVSRLAVPAALALLASGALLQGTLRPSSSAEALRRLNAVATAAHLIREAGPLRCAGETGLAALGPEALSARAYRSWVLAEAGQGGEAELRLVFRAPEEGAVYELRLDAETRRPRELRRTRLGGAAGPGAVEDCGWGREADAPGPERRPR